MRPIQVFTLIILIFINLHAFARSELTFQQLSNKNQPSSIISNDFFTKPENAAVAENLFGKLTFNGFSMQSDPTPIHDPDDNKVMDFIYEKNVQLFPTVEIEFFTDSSNTFLIPKNRDIIAPTGENDYWHILFSTGRVWKETADKGMSRALIPFALVHPIDGDTRNGILTFLYQNEKVSHFQMQIVRQTSMWTVGNFVAWGKGSLTYEKKEWSAYQGLEREFQAERQKAIPIVSWEKLAELYPNKTDNFEGEIPTGAEGKVVSSGIYCEDCLAGQEAFFLKPCKTPYGDLPLCEESRFGMWSVGKSLMTSFAYFALAQDQGPENITGQLVLDIFPEYAELVPKILTTIQPPLAAPLVGWENVALDHAMNMATGIGEGSHKITTFADGYEYHGDDDENHPDYPYAPNFVESEKIYHAWNTAFSLTEKLNHLFQDSQYYPWGPGEVARYRDRDYFLAGTMMSRIFSQSKERSGIDFWDYIQENVLHSLGLGKIPVNRTIEADGGDGKPIWAFGIYPTLGEAVKMTVLLQNYGTYKDRQLLHQEFTKNSLQAGASRKPDQALSTGYKTKADEILYYRGFWQLPYRTNDCLYYVPTMIGWGGNKIALLPNKMIGVQVADHYPEIDNENHEIVSMAKVANAINPFVCQEKQEKK